MPESAVNARINILRLFARLLRIGLNPATEDILLLMAALCPGLATK